MKTAFFCLATFSSSSYFEGTIDNEFVTISNKNLLWSPLAALSPSSSSDYSTGIVQYKTITLEWISNKFAEEAIQDFEQFVNLQHHNHLIINRK